MAESVYKVIELVGTSTESWERATAAAIERAAETLRDLRIAEVVEQDVQVSGGKIEAYRVKLKLSFKYEASESPARAQAERATRQARGGTRARQAKASARPAAGRSRK